MKKTIIFLLIGSILAGAGLLAGITYGFGAVAEVGVRHVAKQKPPEDTAVSWQVDVQDYKRGLFSSETHSKIQVESPAGDIETVDQEGMPFRHVIYHGPVAMTPEGPKFCSYHIVTTLRVDQLDEETRKEIGEWFKGVGESGTIAAAPAVHLAVLDAIRHLGVDHLDMPCTPLRVWQALR